MRVEKAKKINLTRTLQFYDTAISERSYSMISFISDLFHRTSDDVKTTATTGVLRIKVKSKIFF